MAGNPNSAWLVFNVLVLFIGMWLLSHYWSEKKIIQNFSRNIIKNLKDPTQQVLALCAAIYKLRKSFPQDQPDPHFIPLGGFSALGATPATILRKGGYCSGLTRLAIVGLHSLGYKAWQITLYHKFGNAQHCLLEASVGAHNLVIDPTFGFYYLDSKGAPLSFLRLREGQGFSFVFLPGINRDRYYPQNDDYNFDYQNTRTANWTKSPLRKASYLLLCFATKGGIDHVKQPSFLEWPQLILVCCLCGILLIINTFLLIF